MTGWKSKVGGVSAILTGLGLIVKEIAEGTYNFAPGIGFITAGIGGMGIAHKIEKAAT